MSKTVMIVEDEHAFHELYEKMLEDTNYELIRAYDGNEALSKLHEVKPDIIILDMLMDMMMGDTF
ncbi:MAG TPA: response regulator, partial [Candidatus Scalindua sp.]|nr:response regulator [Candidatus Scalindua sp.]